MLTTSQRPAVRSRGREALGPTLIVSLALHLSLLLSLLIIRTEPIPLEASAPPSVEVTADIGIAEGEKLPTPTDAQATPTEAVPTAPVPPPPPPPDQSEVAAVEPPPPMPAPPPPPQPPAAKPAPARTPPPSRAKTPGPKAVSSAGAPPHADGADASSRAEGANRNPDWIGKLKQLWDQHSYYPKEASTTDQGGVVRVHMRIDRDGWIKSVEVVQGSGSEVLDRAAVAVFRDAHLPPFPPGSPDPPAEVVVTLHYVSAHG